MSLLEIVDYSLAFDGFEGTHQVLPDTGEFPPRFGVQPPLGHTDR